MSVNPGFGGQSFIPTAHRKIREIKKLLGARPVDVSVDGGVKVDLAKSLAADGATTLVAGSAGFGAADPPPAGRAPRSPPAGWASSARSRTPGASFPESRRP